MRSQRLIATVGQRATHAEMTYQCDLCGHEELHAATDVAEFPTMHGLLVCHGESPGADFINCQSTERHCCSKCLRALQRTFQCFDDPVVIRSRG